jgi:hypothetical protein
VDRTKRARNHSPRKGMRPSHTICGRDLFGQ